MPDLENDAEKVSLERKKEQARKRAKAVRESAMFSRKKRERTLTPGVRIIGSSLFEDDKDAVEENEKLEGAVASFVLRKGGFAVTEETSVDTLSKMRDCEDVMSIMIAKIVGLDDRWGLDRKFISNSIHAHRFEDGVVIEYSLESYGGFVSRTYYVVDGLTFRAFAQHNYRKAE
ncbi:MAG: hypothetical protein EAX95_03645 [Candidatus Thorarchaeota archaeon]|nr:hypothetical protein [Candidatus Thorarchaeota archaeon]